ncbi:DNA segregation ATPase FtsK/SpoIIIE, S-DNA-T family [Abditibacterium utsteinense]|uniref:DNA segregation ATPase FtsK/SpoIIIE, S-DNA-T family n=1 Tax=Abditibacterium utsteinense TaxID=1960156 RepID=A0A2S8SU90_9BACT|nr:DNA translocase FtsK [Abditibacterium utsteinense]PQV64365.1 DNA segregation ATPase FtsK/SpoIIIE, S-DNA-T family [Abditibacterium utsteinense]
MSRFPAPLDDFETDDFDIPTFEAPQRRQSRPDSSASSAPRRAASRPASNSRPATNSRPTTNARLAPPRDDFEDFEPRGEVRIARPRPSTLAANRPKTGTSSTKNGGKPAPRRVSTQAARAKTNSRAPRVLRGVHFQSGGVLLIALGGLLAYNARQISPDGALPHYLLLGLRSLFGIGATILPVGLVLLGGLLLVKRQNSNLRAFWRGAGTAFFTILTASHLLVPRGAEFDKSLISQHGGYIGAILARVLRFGLGEAGAIVALGAFAIIALLLWSENTLGELGRNLGAKISDIARGVEEKWSDGKGEMKSRLEEKAAQKAAAREEETGTWDDEETEEWDESGDYEIEDAPQTFAPRRTLPPEISREAQAAKSRRPSPFLAVEDVIGSAAPENDSTKNEEKASAEKFPDAPTPALDPNSTLEAPKFIEKAVEEKPVDFPKIEILDAPPPSSVVDFAPASSLDIRAAIAGENADRELTPNEALELQAEQSAQGDVEIKRPKTELPRRSFGDGPLMPTYFDDAVRALDPPVPPDNAGAEEEIQKGVLGVQETLAAFKIDARVTDVKRGPVITRYEVQPGAGVRVASIANLDKDLARSLSALAVRIEAPVPGKNVVGIEIPNKKVNLVRMRDVLEQPEFLAHPSKLAFVLGKDIAGQPKWGDLTKMPHMLIAGSTNSGKSVCLNSIIASILVRAQPDEVRFSLIDPKRVELTLYKGIKHLMHDVVVEPKQAVIALRRAIEEMDRRYKLFASRGVRNIVSFNSKLQENEKPLPYIVIVIDELADLMMTAAAEFEKLICRLAQLARATGIHLIVATQRPSVNVITGVIKANIPARIAFAVASQVDSRTILDSVGAERLIGSGDMLYDSNNGGKSVRIQGAFLSEEEVNRIVEVAKAAYTYEEDTPDDLPTFDLYSEDADADFEGEKPASTEKRDALYDQILEFVARHQEMSASLIQRKFEIGYPRAGRIVDHLERDGILGPPDGPKPRKVLGASRE